MRIGIDGHPLHGRRTGVGRYVWELCRELDTMLPDSHFFVYSSLPVDMPVVSDRWTARLDTLPVSRFLKAKLWLKLRCGYFCRRDRLDVFWGTTGFLPGLPSGVRKVITVYDLNFKVVPETMSTLNRWAFNLFFRKDVNKADMITAISQGTADRLYNYYGKRASAIVYPSVGKHFYRRPDAEISSYLDRHNISTPYILSVATWEPRKNMELLLTVFLAMKKRGELNNYKLVLAGGKGWKYGNTASLLKTTDAGSVINLDYVPDEELPLLYAGADMFILPSLYEGFGLPVLEARACGTRAIASDIPEMREAGGEDSIYVSPTAEGIRGGILSAITTEKYKPVHTANRTWTEGAEILADAFSLRLLR